MCPSLPVIDSESSPYWDGAFEHKFAWVFPDAFLFLLNVQNRANVQKFQGRARSLRRVPGPLPRQLLGHGQRPQQGMTMIDMKIFVGKPVLP